MLVKYSALEKTKLTKKAKIELIEKEEKEIISIIETWVNNEKETSDHVTTYPTMYRKRFIGGIVKKMVEKGYLCYLDDEWNDNFKYPIRFVVALPSHKFDYLGKPSVKVWASPELLEISKQKK